MERALERFGLRYAAVARIAVVFVCAPLAVLAVPPDMRLSTAAVAVLLVLWTSAYVFLLRHPGVDLVVIIGLCVTQPWTVFGSAVYDGTSWTLVVSTIAAAAYQWHTSLTFGLVATALLVGAHVAGTVIAAPMEWSAGLPLCVWIVATAGLSRGLFGILRRAARTTDQLHAQEERERREAAVAAARRADHREFLALLHDTTATTLLMVGMGTVPRREMWLCEQADRDLEVLTEAPLTTVDSVDLPALLDGAARESRLNVRQEMSGSVALPSAAAIALFLATREALTNAWRHAGVSEVVLRLVGHQDRAVVEVVDEGRGFDPARVSPGAHGLSGSIVGRLARAGGRAIVESRDGRGTTVRLEWPRG
ncbi:ATP-binding protein [Allokutzneria sp. A3M-2-11 16]|uniref:sensor histidine kinase n=1 Tax=Allokutzneria sp. A3M-2-11 16 TaxID=2962043 RepID=UPI0020B76A6E|nr:ATP-binding protein [Allokutzneria sp. A3M-2-11 16]MCP3804994.1 ATP-binding protein [Allokutzneria sp. A3M-2-11 16]